MRKRSQTIFTALGGVIIGALLVGVLPAVAGTGDVFHHGREEPGRHAHQLKANGRQGLSGVTRSALASCPPRF